MNFIPAVSWRRSGLFGIVSLRSRPSCDLFDRRLPPEDLVPDFGSCLRTFGHSFPGLSWRMSLFLRRLGLRQTWSRWVQSIRRVFDVDFGLSKMDWTLIDLKESEWFTFHLWRSASLPVIDWDPSPVYRTWAVGFFFNNWKSILHQCRWRLAFSFVC